MSSNHQLTPKLKSLRLSGILETLDVRKQQAITELRLIRFGGHLPKGGCLGWRT